MKLLKLLTVCLVISNLASAQVELNNTIDSLSYSLGADIGDKLKKSGVKEINGEILSKAVQVAIEGGDLQISTEEGMRLIQNYFMALQNKASNENKKKGEDFLAANKSKKGVIVTESGLQYLVLKEGVGAKPVATDKVKVHYHGTLIDGKVFDSSVDRGEPIEFNVNGVIKGWQEALQLMPVGSKWRVFIPGDLAYGSRGAGGSIGPNETLIFEIELLDIVAQ